MKKNTSFAPFLAFAVSVLGAGCVSWHVGDRESYTFQVDEKTTEAGVLSSECVAARPVLAPLSDNRVSMVLTADFKDEIRILRIPIERTVEKQKRMTFGFYPALGAFPTTTKERPGFSALLTNDVRRKLPAQTMLCISPLGTLYSLFVPLFYGDYESPFKYWVAHEADCTMQWDRQFNRWELKPVRPSHFDYDERTGYYKFNPMKSQAFQDFWKAPASVREQLNIWTLGEEDSHPNPSPYPLLFNHFSLVGFVRGCDVWIGDRKERTPIPAGTRTNLRNGVAVQGPFDIEVSIPDLSWSRRETVSAGQTEAMVLFPVLEEPKTVEAVVQFFRAPGRAPSSDTELALEKVSSGTLRIYVPLRGKKKPVPPRSEKPDALAARTVEHLTPYGNLRKTVRKDGRIEIRISVYNNSGMNTANVERENRSEIKRMLREDYLDGHPGELDGYVQTHYGWYTSDDGREIIATGWAFSVRPIEEGSSYDPDTRRGWIRLRVSGDMPKKDAERWAHDNIGEIVRYKNVVLEVGKAPPPGAQYRSLSESFEDGILTVEFEAVQ